MGATTEEVVIFKEIIRERAIEDFIKKIGIGGGETSTLMKAAVAVKGEIVARLFSLGAMDSADETHSPTDGPARRARHPG